jgi:hypothetical protein
MLPGLKTLARERADYFCFPNAFISKPKPNPSGSISSSHRLPSRPTNIRSLRSL